MEWNEMQTKTTMDVDDGAIMIILIKSIAVDMVTFWGAREITHSQSVCQFLVGLFLCQQQWLVKIKTRRERRRKGEERRVAMKLTLPSDDDNVLLGRPFPQLTLLIIISWTRQMPSNAPLQP